MIDPQSRAVLQSLIQRESHSLLHYVCESFPWTTSREQEALDRLHQINQEEMDATAVLARFLFKHHIVAAALGSYPMAYTNINYMALDHLFPLLIDDEKGRIDELQRDLSKIKDVDARQQVARSLEMKRRHLQVLEQVGDGLKGSKPSASFAS